MSDPNHDWALFLDFDGTLVDIAPTPDGVAVAPFLRPALRRLRDRLGGALALVSGRSIADLDRHLGDLALDACGLHGLEWRIGGRVERPERPSLAPDVEALRRLFADRPGIVVEDKGIGLALHWRQDPDGEESCRREIARLAGRLGPPYRVQDGKAVSEIVPGRAGKGDGIRAMMEEAPYRGRRPCFVGDDRTDEHGFEAATALGGVAVKIGGGETSATRRVASVAEFAAILAGWASSDLEPSALPTA